MKKIDLFNEYQAMLAEGKQPDQIILYIHMPNSEHPEIILNQDVADKLAYIDKTYDDDLVHSGCKDIYITDAILCTWPETVTFGDALEAAKDGHRISRKGWNGKGMYVFLAKDVQFHTEADISEFNPEKATEETDRNAVEVSNMLVLRTAQGTLQPGWLATQSDMLADDWYILPDACEEENDDA